MNLLFDTIVSIASDGIPSLFRRNLPKPIHRLAAGLAAWIIVIVGMASFFLTEVPPLETYRQLLKTAVLGGIVIFVAVLVAITLSLKSQKES